MSIPDFDEHGHLPEGIHDCSIAELTERFGQFQSTDRRCRLMERLEAYLNELASTGLASFVIIDGSFVTAKTEPEDIDLIVVLKSEHDFGAELRPFEYNVLSRKSVRRIYRFDVLLAEEDKPEYDEYVAFFTQVRNESGQTKGMIKVIP